MKGLDVGCNLGGTGVFYLDKLGGSRTRNGTGHRRRTRPTRGAASHGGLGTRKTGGYGPSALTSGISEIGHLPHYFATAREPLDFGRPFGTGLGDCTGAGGGAEADGRDGGKVGVGWLSGSVPTRELGSMPSTNVVG